MFPHLNFLNGCTISTLEWASIINIIVKQVLKKKITNRISQGTLLKNVFICKRLLTITLVSLKECDQGSLGLSIVSKNLSLVTICHKRFQSTL
jgi:hypothetical protein